MGRDQEAIPRMDMHTLPCLHLYQLKRTDTLDLHQLILQDTLSDRLHEQPQEAFRLLMLTSRAFR